MEEEVTVALASIEQRGADFRTQVEQLRRFREQLKEAGAALEPPPFSIPLMERIETPQERIFMRLKVPDCA